VEPPCATIPFLTDSTGFGPRAPAGPTRAKAVRPLAPPSRTGPSQKPAGYPRAGRTIETPACSKLLNHGIVGVSYPTESHRHSVLIPSFREQTTAGEYVWYTVWRLQEAIETLTTDYARSIPPTRLHNLLDALRPTAR